MLETDSEQSRSMAACFPPWLGAGPEYCPLLALLATPSPGLQAAYLPRCPGEEREAEESKKVS